ncbi:hypothetical protein ACVWZL_008971 [Bradyrhizobium sp. GM2.4]
MPKLKLGAIHDDKPIKITHELPASVHRDLVAYAEILAQETAQPIAAIQLSLSRPCWPGSWQPTGASGKRATRVSDHSKAMGSAQRPT